jgi:hypothetical protein
MRSLRRQGVALRVAVLLVIVLVAGTLAFAQGRRGGRFGGSVPLATPESFDGGFQFCRLAFRGSRGGDGGSWSVDFPRAEVNLSIRLSELTHTPVSFDANREPRHLVVRPTDDTLFQCPFVMATEVGAAYFDEQESARLREYLVKGGFLWVDDFWGSYAWEYWESQLARILPPGEYPVLDLPPAHPLFRAQFEVNGVPQIPSINFWGGTGGETSERGADSRTPHARAVLDRSGNIMVLMTHNTDIGDSWEREGDDPDYFYTFSVNGYAFGINTLLYAMTH